jgi:type I restriction enzyme M protein
LRCFFNTQLDVTINGIETPVAKYLNHVWEGIGFEDYQRLLKKEPNQKISQHEIYTEYCKKLKFKNEAEFWKIVLEKEAEKLFYFILAYPQKVVLIKSGEKDAEKRFLGYEFSNRRGSEGIHAIQRDKNIEECTQMFDPEAFDNPTKASTYVYKAFGGDYDFPIDETMQNNVYRHHLVDLLTFDRVDFEKNISLSVKKKVKIESQWEIVKLEDVIELISGQSPESDFYNQEKKGLPFYQEKTEFVELYLEEPKYWTEKITKVSLKSDVLMTVRAPVGPVNINLFDKICIGRGLNAMRVSDKIFNIYLFYYLKSNQEQIKGNEGAIFESISRDQVLSLKIPLQPLEIQQKIVSEIESLEVEEVALKEEVERLKIRGNEIFGKFDASKKVSLEDISENLDSYRKPVTKGYRNIGDIPYYGASGIIDYVSDYILDDYVLLTKVSEQNKRQIIRYL